MGGVGLGGVRPPPLALGRQRHDGHESDLVGSLRPLDPEYPSVKAVGHGKDRLTSLLSLEPRVFILHCTRAHSAAGPANGSGGGYTGLHRPVLSSGRWATMWYSSPAIGSQTLVGGRNALESLFK